MPKPGIGGTPTNRTKTMETGKDADIMATAKKPKVNKNSVMGMLADARPRKMGEIDR